MTPEAPLYEPLAKTLTRKEDHYLETGLPWVTLAYAQSLDGSIAAQRGKPLVISNDSSLMLGFNFAFSRISLAMAISFSMA